MTNGWVEPDTVSIEPWHCCLSMRVEGVVTVVHGLFSVQGLGQGCVCPDDD